jgi:hypothetical protein
MTNRAGRRLRGRSRRASLRILAVNWRGVVVLVATVGAILAVAIWLEPDAFMRGLLLGVGATATLAMLAYVAATFNAEQHLRFASAGEELTADVFEARRMRRRGWQIVHNLEFDGFGDVDHVAVGPAGILAIESKWTNLPWVVKDGMLRVLGRDPLAQARRSARKIRLFLRSEGVVVEPVPLLVIWGSGAPTEADEGLWINGVLVVAGRGSRDWCDRLEALTHQTVDGAIAAGATQNLQRFAAGAQRR